MIQEYLQAMIERLQPANSDSWAHAQMCHGLSDEHLQREPLKRWEKTLMRRYPAGLHPRGAKV